MNRELLEIVEQDQIDRETAGRLGSCLDSEFRSSPIRYFDARRVAVVSGSNELLLIRIAGFGEYLKGKQLICSNIDNPENLEVNMADCEMVFQSEKDPRVFYVKGGETEITGPKYSDATKDLEPLAEVMKILPRKDPDIVQIDNRVFHQTGTVHIRGPHYFVCLER